MEPRSTVDISEMEIEGPIYQYLLDNHMKMEDQNLKLTRVQQAQLYEELASLPPTERIERQDHIGHVMEYGSFRVDVVDREPPTIEGSVTVE